MKKKNILAKIEQLAELDAGLRDGDVLATWDLTPAAIRFLVLAAEILEEMHRKNLSTRLFDAGLGISIFRDKSTRTRHAFRAGCNLVGLTEGELDESTSQIAHGETVRETAAMIAFGTEAVGVRDDMFLGEGHAYMSQVSASLAECHAVGVLPNRPAVINLQSDLDHPTQSMADLCHLASVFGGLDNLKGKKLAMTWAHSPSYGKPLSVPQAVVALMTRFGMNVVLAHPEGYSLEEEPLAAARRFAEESGGSFEIQASMDSAFEGADIVYPKSWAPASVMRERTRLLRAGERDKLVDLERAALAQNEIYKDWECTEDRMAKTKDGKALYMHCLPADVSSVSCVSGEVSRAVFEKARLDTYREASHKPFVIAAMLLATRVPKPAATLAKLLGEAKPRHR
ncbi:MAG: knotted carbamoyltransferase YgeW [Byssovorax sp.]